MKKIILILMAINSINVFAHTDTCIAEINLFKKVKIPSVGIIEESIEILNSDNEMIKKSLSKKGYDLTTSGAHKYSNGISIYVSFDQRYKNVEISYAHWSKKSYNGVIPSFGDIELGNQRAQINAKNLKNALKITLSNMSSCNDVLALIEN